MDTPNTGGRGAQAVSFTLTDDRGNSHEYYCIPHGSSKGWPLGLRLIKILGRALGLALGDIEANELPAAINDIKGKLAENADDAGIDLTSQESVLDIQITYGMMAKFLAGAGIGLSELAGMLLAEPQLVHEILAHTTRDNKKVNQVFEVAYQANYGELVKALFEVCKINWGPLFLQRFGGLLASTAGRVMSG